MEPTGFRQRRIYSHFPPNKQACRSSSLVCAPVFGTMCRASSTPRSKSFACGLQSTKPIANDRREFAIAIAKQNKIFKVCGFTYTLRQFFAPVFAHECQCYHRLVVTLLPTEREARSGSTPKSSLSKSKRDAQGVPFTFWWNRRGFAKGEYTCTFRLTSKLVDLQVRYVHPYSAQCAEQVQLASRIRQKAKGTHKASLSLFGGTDGS